MTATERSDLLADLVDHLLAGVYSDNGLAKLCKVDRDTVKRYKPAAFKIIANTQVDQNQIRTLEIQRTYTRIDTLYKELDQKKLSVKDKMAIHNQIAKAESHLALITGLNVQTTINVNRKQLVITRAHPADVKKAKKEAGVIDVE